MNSPGVNPHRVSQAHVDWLEARFSARDWAILGTVNRLRLATGQHLERLHFAELAGRSRAVSRWRVLARLVEWRVLVPLDRRIGGSLKGSAQTVFAVDSAGTRLLRHRSNEQSNRRPVRRPGLPGERFVRHTLAVTDLYVQLVVQSRGGGFTLADFAAEPSCWWPDGQGGWLKPDAYAVLSSQDFDEHVWLEVDLATESLPALRRQLLAYLDFVHRGERGPAAVVPRVLVAVPHKARVQAVADLVAGLPAPAAELFVLNKHEDAVQTLTALVAEPPEADPV